jgi:hypothetical protein
MEQDITPPVRHTNHHTQHHNVQYEESKNKQKKWIIVVIVVVLVMSMGYWFGVRPYFIRRECNKLAVNVADNGYPSEINTDFFASKYYADYQICLSARGL